MKYSQGFSLIEVLITLVLTVVGVLGVVAMQTKAIQYTTDSVTRSAAVMLVDDLLEVLRSNRDKIYNNNNKLRDDSEYFKKRGDAFSDLSCKTYDGLPSAENPKQQLCVWAKYAQTLLPGVTEEVLKNGYYVEKDGNAIRIRVAWQVKVGECTDKIAGDGYDLCLYTMIAEI